MLTKEEKQTILERRYTASFYAPWAEAALFQTIIENVAEPFRDANIGKVLGLEARDLFWELQLPTSFAPVSSSHAKLAICIKDCMLLKMYSKNLALITQVKTRYLKLKLTHTGFSQVIAS